MLKKANFDHLNNYYNVNSDNAGVFQHDKTGATTDIRIQLNTDGSLDIRQETVIEGANFCDLVEFFLDHTDGMFPDYTYFNNIDRVATDFEQFPKFKENKWRDFKYANALAQKYLLDFEENMLNAVSRANFKSLYQTNI